MKKGILMLVSAILVAACGTKQPQGEEETIGVTVERATLTSDYNPDE